MVDYVAQCPEGDQAVENDLGPQVPATIVENQAERDAGGACKEAKERWSEGRGHQSIEAPQSHQRSGGGGVSGRRGCRLV